MNATNAKAMATIRYEKELDAMMGMTTTTNGGRKRVCVVVVVVVDIKKKRGIILLHVYFFLEVFSKWYSNRLHNYK